MTRRELYQAFQQAFPLEALKDMPLERYSNLNKEDSFCYWLESRTYELGSFWGGSSYKFLIYRYNNKPAEGDPRITFDDKYAWYSNLGKDTAEEAYQVVRDEIVKVATLAQQGDFDAIDSLDRLGHSYKWKIAFLYSKENLIPIYNRGMLQIVAKELGMKNVQKVRIFPIIECTQLKQIVVPEELLAYYQDSLPYYKNIITEKEGSDEDIIFFEHKEENRIVSEKRTEKPLDKVDDSGIEHVYVDLPSAGPYTEYEVEQDAKSDFIVQGDEKKPIDINKFQTVFDKKASSYKYFWLMAIISLAKEKKNLTIPYKDITIRMAAMAWSIVFDNEIDLGSRDMMYKYLDEVVKKTTLIRTASSNVVENYLLQHYSSHGVDKILSPLLKNVPYRFLSPWIKFTTTDDVIEKSRKTNFDGLYAIHTNGITLSEEWWKYIKDNYLEVCDFAMRSFISYAKQYNSDMKLLKLMTTGWSFVKRK